jgi:hypothetical protein
MPENFENHDESQQEETVEQPPEIKVESQIEQELSPEVIEKIMAKVVNIDMPEIGYHVSFRGEIETIFQNGLLGQNRENRDRCQIADRKSWANEIRKNKKGVVFFNITGRSDKELDRLNSGKSEEDTEISYSYFVRPQRKGTCYVILFDISNFKEEGLDAKKLGSKKYKPDNVSGRDVEMGYEDWKDTGFDPEKYFPYSRINTEYGYVLSFRVAPKFFEGIVIKPSGPETKHKENMSTEVQKVLKLMAGNKNVLLPIYDVHGNLLWPKQMNYEEVKKFVTEREKQKEEEK